MSTLGEERYGESRGTRVQRSTNSSELGEKGEPDLSAAGLAAPLSAVTMSGRVPTL
jgi:hypothetical protein